MEAYRGHAQVRRLDRQVESAMKKEPEVLTFQEACDFLRVSQETLRSMVRRKKVPHIRTSGATSRSEYRFSRTALTEWMGRGG